MGYKGSLVQRIIEDRVFSIVQKEAMDLAKGSNMLLKLLSKSRVWLAVIVALWVIPYFLNIYTLYVFSWFLVYLIAAIGLNLIMGYAGQISLGQAGFLAIGAYTVSLLTTNGCSFWLALPLGGVLAFAVGLALGIPSLQVKHHYLAMVTLGFGIIVYKALVNEKEITGGTYGILNIPRPKLGSISLQSDLAYAHLIVLITMAMVMVMYWILNTSWGRAFKMIRENEIRAEVLGVNLRTYKLSAFAIGSGYGGVAGGLLAPLLTYMDPTAFQFYVSFDFLFIVIIGGMGRLLGPVIGTTVVILMPEILRIARQLNLIIFSLIAVLVLIAAPRGGIFFVDWIYKLLTGKKTLSLTK